MLEFALGSGILMAAFSGTYQFGYTFLQYNTLENAVTRGARYASLTPYDSASTTASTAFQTAVTNMVLYGTPTQTVDSKLATNGLTSSNVTLTVAFANGVPSTMTVAINSYTINSVFGTTNLSNKPQVTYTYQGIWSPI